MLDLEKLLELIAKEKETLSSPVHYKEEELALLSQFLETDESDLIKVVHQTDSDIVVRSVLLAFNGSSFSLDEINRLTEKNKQINDLDPEHTLKIIKEINKIKSLKMLERVKALVRKSDYSEEELSTTEYSIMKNIESILNDAECSEYDLESLLTLATSKSDYFRIALPLVQLTKKMYQPTIRLRLHQNEDGTVKITQQQIETRTKYVNINGDALVADRAMQNSLIRVKSYYEKLKSEKAALEKSRAKELAAIKNLEEQLPSLLAGSEITNIKELLNRITSPELRLETLKLVYLHNKTFYDELSKEYKKLSAHKASKYKSFLNQYGIFIDDEIIPYVMLNSIDDVKKILKALTKLGLDDPNTLLNVLTRSTLSTINSIQDQINRGIISSELILSNPNILCSDSKEYKNLFENLNFLQEKSLNPHYFRSNQRLLLEDPNTIKNNIEVLETYNLVSSMKTGMDCHFLVSKNLEEGIDLLLELGYESMLEQNLSLLSYQHNFKRLRVLKALSIPITSFEELEAVLTTDKFLIPDASIDDYLYNATPYNLPPVQLSNAPQEPEDILCSFSKTKKTYDIGGVILSKNRVKRNLSIIENSNSIDGIFYSIIKDSYLSDEEISRIRDVIIPKEKIKKEN